ncbi:Phosphatidylserine decarboxylase proenzyme [Gossypium arboreum]|uniref:Phosphatidylserine decarboxylase proenzyme n=1 Tax=Gossypium arboreum TaxID=29729 RepID=A0A0B0PCM7_GOSAR|nr:Phosphatidylserine decarboxylase proenzyme [Gossypium arboreum]
MCMRVLEYLLVFQVVQQVIQRLCERIDKYRQASLGIEGTLELDSHYQTNLLGIVNSSILSMACLGTWSFCYMSYWFSQMCCLIMI